MARKTSSRLQKRREAEAADASPKAKTKAEGKKPAKKRVTRRKAKVPDRKRVFWGVFSGTLKEEARFNYDELKQAEEKLELLRSKSKKLYFIQPIKEVITADGSTVPLESDVKPAKAPRAKAAPKDVEEDDEPEGDDDDE